MNTLPRKKGDLPRMAKQGLEAGPYERSSYNPIEPQNNRVVLYFKTPRARNTKDKTSSHETSASNSTLDTQSDFLKVSLTRQNRGNKKIHFTITHDLGCQEDARQRTMLSQFVQDERFMIWELSNI